MGAWGPGNFECDEALDWVHAFEQEWSPRLIRAQLEDYLLSSEEPEYALAAAELVAALRGHPSADLPEAPGQWASEGGDHDDPGLPRLAVEVVKHVMAHSELRALWEESGEAKAWLDVERELIRRLRAPAMPTARLKAHAREVSQVPPRIGLARARTFETEWTQFADYDRDAFRRSPPPLTRGPPGAEAVHRVEIDIAQAWEDEDFRLLAAWLAPHPDLTLALSDATQPPRTRVDPTVIRWFPEVRRLFLYLKTARRVEGVLGELQKLEALTLFDTPVRDLSFAADLEHLTALSIHLCRQVTELTPLRRCTALWYLSLGSLPKVSVLPSLGALDVLETLRVENLPHISALPSFGRLRSLRYLYLSVDGIPDLSPAAKAKKLEELVLAGDGDQLEPARVEVFRDHPTLRRFAFFDHKGRREVSRAVESVLGLPRVDTNDWPNPF
jgi:hypothetical protein